MRSHPHVRRLPRARAVCAAVALLASLLLAGVLAAGCGAATYVVRQYSGPERPSEAVAVLRVNGGKGPRLVELDGERLDFKLIRGEHLHVQMLTGEHSLGVVNPAIDPLHGLLVRFRADAGRMYRIIIRQAPGELGPGWAPDVVEVAPDTDQVLGQATLVPVEGAQPPPPAAAGTSPSPPAAAGTSPSPPAAAGTSPSPPAAAGTSPAPDGGPDLAPLEQGAPPLELSPDAGLTDPDAGARR